MTSSIMVNMQKKQMGGFMGNLYQSKISMVLLLNGSALGYEFELGTEIEAAEKFDDVTFSYKNKVNKEDHVIIIQAKHKVKTTDKIKREDLLTADDVNFGLVKYFNSYQKAKNSELFKNTTIDFAIVYTNTQFNELEGDPFWIKIDVDENSVLRLCKIGERGDFYKFDTDKLLPILKPMIMRYCCEHTKIAERLVKIFLGNLTLLSSEFKETDCLLVNEVIDVESKKFRDSFIDGDKNDSDELQHFRKILTSILENKGICLKDVNNQNNKFNISKGFGKLNDKQCWPKINNIVDQDIREFLDKIVFAVGQPNEDELGKALEDEIQEKYFTNNITYKYLIDESNNWTKGGNFFGSKIFISHVNARKFFTDLNISLNGEILRKSITSYLKNVRELEFHFQDPEMQQILENFLISEEQLINITTKFTKLSVVKVYQFLKYFNSKINSEIKDTIDNFLFFNLRSPINLNDINMITKSFENPLCSHSPLIIEVNDVKIKNFVTLVKTVQKDLADLLKKKSDKKVILIQLMSSTMVFEGIIKEFSTSRQNKLFKDINVHFENLKPESQKRILNDQCVYFQNSIVKLNEIFNESSKSLIKGDLLTSFISDEIPEIGTLYEGSKELEQYYISRSFSFEVKYENNLLILSGFNEEDICMLLQNDHESWTISQQKEKLSINELQPNDHLLDQLSRILTIEQKLEFSSDEQNLIIISESEKSQLQQDLGLETNEEICFLEKEGSNFIPVKRTSKFSIELEKMKKAIILEFGKKCILLPSIAGMGKSSVFDILCVHMKEKNSAMWIYKIILNDLTKLLSKLNSEEINDNSLVIFLKDALKLNTDVEIELFKNYLEEKHVVLLFDGIDEISPDYTKTVYNIIKKLDSKKGVKRIFISTRPHDSVINNMKDLNSILCNLQPFEIRNRAEFLQKFWFKNNEIDDFRVELCEGFSNSLLSIISNNINDTENDFLRTPIHLMMMASVMLEVLKGFWNNEIPESIHTQQEKFIDMLEVSNLYEKFIELKFFNIHQTDKNKIDITVPAISQMVQNTYDSFIHNCENISLKNILDQIQINSLLGVEELRSLEGFENEITAGKYNFGIINKIINGEANFVHKTYGDYFVARFIIKEFRKEPKDEEELDNRKKRITLLFEAIMKREQIAICNFLDNMLKKYISNDHKTFENYLYSEKLVDGIIHFVMKNGWGSIAILLINNGIDFHQIDEYRETVFHLLPKCYNSDYILTFLLKEKLKDQPTDTTIDFLKQKNAFGMIPLFTSILNSDIDCTKLFIETMKQLNILDIIHSDILYILAMCSNHEICKMIFNELTLTEQKKMLLEKNDNDVTPLHIAARHGRSLYLFEKLNEFEMLPDLIDLRDIDGCNILHVIGMNSNKQFYQVILNMLKTNLNLLMQLLQQKNKNQHTPLAVIIVNNNVMCFEILFETLKDLNLLSTIAYANDIGNDLNILEMLSYSDHKEMIQILFEELKTDRDTLKKLLIQKAVASKSSLVRAVMINKIDFCSIVFRTLRELDLLSILIDMKLEQKMQSSYGDENCSDLNILHILTIEARDEITLLLFDELKSNSDILKQLLIQKTNTNHVPLSFSLSKNNIGFCSIVFQTLRKLSKLCFLIDMKFYRRVETNSGIENDFNLNILQVLASKEYVKITQSLFVELKTDPDTLKKLLTQKIDNSKLPLEIAILANNFFFCSIVFQTLRELNMINLLIDLKFCRNVPIESGKKNDSNLNISHILAFDNCKEITQSLFVELRDDPDTLKKLLIKNNDTGEFSLNYAIRENNIDFCSIVFRTLRELNILNFLIDMKFHCIFLADFGKKYDSNANILHILASLICTEITQLLFDELKTDPDTLEILFSHKTKGDYFPLELAVAVNNIHFCSILFQKLKELEMLHILISVQIHDKTQQETGVDTNIIVNILYCLLSSEERNEITQLLFENLKTKPVILKKLLFQEIRPNTSHLFFAMTKNNVGFCSIVFQTLKELKILNILVDVNIALVNYNILHLLVSTHFTIKKCDKIFGLLIQYLKSDIVALRKLFSQKCYFNLTPLQLAIQYNCKLRSYP